MTTLSTPPTAVTPDAITPDTIAAVERLIRPYVRRTPVIRLDRAEWGLPPGPLVLKLEQLQHAGSFKARGAFANLLLRGIPEAGVVAASGGNHGVAVAYAARALGVPARIFVPTVSSPAKIARIREYGADLVIEGDTYADALAASEQWQAGSGALPVHAFDQVETILATGTIALELREQVEDATTVLAAVGGGGLAAGIAAGATGWARVIGVEPETAPTLTMALDAGRPVDAPAGGVAVDSLAPRRVGVAPYQVLSRLLDRAILVEDDAIRHTQRLLWDRLRIVAEPGGAAPLAAIVSGRYQPEAGEVTAVVITGANTTAVDFDR